jgi:protein TonB
MENKKSRKAILEGSKTSSFMMGLIVALALLFVGFEWTEYDVKAAPDWIGRDIIAEEFDPVVLMRELPPPPPPASAATVLNVVKNDTNLDPQPILTTEEKPGDPLPPPPPPVLPNLPEEPILSDLVFPFNLERMPELPGLMEFLSSTIRYPSAAAEAGIQGKVICSFIVNKDGSISDAKIVRGIYPSLDSEALRVIGMMPNWKPGIHNGKAVRVNFTLPVTFKLQ